MWPVNGGRILSPPISAAEVRVSDALDPWKQPLSACWLKAVPLACAAGAAAPLPGQAQAAGAAYAVDTAEVGDPGNCKVESWMSSASNHDFIAAVTPTCVLDITRPVEASAQLTRSRADGEWASGATPKLKTNLVPSAIGSWGVAASMAASYDLIARENAALAATIPATLRLSNVGRINLNAGWQWDRIANLHYLPTAPAPTGAHPTMSGL